MLARIFSCAVVGLDGVIIEVEVDYTNGLPGMTIVGLPDTAVQESRRPLSRTRACTSRVIVSLSTCRPRLSARKVPPTTYPSRSA